MVFTVPPVASFIAALSTMRSRSRTSRYSPLSEKLGASGPS
jgi:hypothetical protein